MKRTTKVQQLLKIERAYHVQDSPESEWFRPQPSCVWWHMVCEV